MLTVSFLLTVILFAFTTSAKAWTITPVFSEQKDTHSISQYSSLKELSLWDYYTPTTYCNIQQNKSPVYDCSGGSCPRGARSEPHFHNTTTSPPTTNTTTRLRDRKTAGVREIANIALRLAIGAMVLYGFLMVIPIVSVFLVYKLSIWSVRYLS